MRYSISKSGSSIDEITRDVAGVGGGNIKTTRQLGLIFADLNEDQQHQLLQKGYSVNVMKKTTTPSQITPPTPVPSIPKYSPENVSYSIKIDDFRKLTVPPLYGEGVNIAMIDTGVRSSHVMVNGRVVKSMNFTSSPNGDGFDHGTGVASIIVTLAPSCNLIDLKVIEDSGEGTEEEALLAIDYILQMHEDEDEFAPTIVNMSIGAIDDGDPDSIMRAGVRELISKNIWVVVAAGNGGPDDMSMLSPAVEKYVIAVGSCNLDNLYASEFSSKGPTIEGLIKPDCMLFGENLAVASSEGDDVIVAKSGTSFASPFVAGIFGLWQEYTAVDASYVSGQQVSIKEAILTPQQVIEDYLPTMTGKPVGADTAKDNTYGYGILLPDLTKKALTGVGEGINLDTVIPMIMMVGMMGMVMGSMKE